MRNNPLKLLLADDKYNQYLHLKNILADPRMQSSVATEMFWCGEESEISIALQSNLYDLAVIAYSAASLFAAEYARSLGIHTPVVMTIDRNGKLPAARVRISGILAIIDRQHIDRAVLQHYLLYAETQRQRKNTSGVFRAIAPSSFIAPDRAGDNLALL